MDSIITVASRVCNHLESLEEVISCKIYGSIKNNTYDDYSDIDIEVDVSGSDNSLFLAEIPRIINQVYPVVYFDYAPSLMPEIYICSCAISTEKPFLIIDIKCVATPHITTLDKVDYKNDAYSHILKLWIANVKHYLRSKDCKEDISHMYKKLFIKEPLEDEKEMLLETFQWLTLNKTPQYDGYLIKCKEVISNL